MTLSASIFHPKSGAERVSDEIRLCLLGLNGSKTVPFTIWSKILLGSMKQNLLALGKKKKNVFQHFYHRPLWFAQNQHILLIDLKKIN